MQNHIISYLTILRTSNSYIIPAPSFFFSPPTYYQSLDEKILAKQSLIKFVSGSSMESVFKEVPQNLNAIHSFVYFQMGLL